MKCKVCNEENCRNIGCKKAICKVKKQIEHQRKISRMDFTFLKCNECGKEKKKGAQYCVECVEKRTIANYKRGNEARKKNRRCKSDGCYTRLPKGSPSSLKYCKTCRPESLHTTEKQRERIRVEAKKNEVDPFKGTIDPKWLTRGDVSTRGDRLFGHGKES